MHPVLFQIGSFVLHTYGVLLAAALIAGVLTVVRLGKREGLDSGRLLDFSTWIIVVALIGAKVLMILTDWDFYWHNPGARPQGQPRPVHSVLCFQSSSASSGVATRLGARTAHLS